MSLYHLAAPFSLHQSDHAARRSIAMGEAQRQRDHAAQDRTDHHGFQSEVLEDPQPAAQKSAVGTSALLPMLRAG